MPKKNNVTAKTKIDLSIIANILAFTVLTSVALGFFIGVLNYGLVGTTLQLGQNGTGLVGWWTFDENQGNTIANYVGGQTSPIWYNGNSNGWPANTPPWSATAVNGTALTFSGFRSYSLLSNNFSEVDNNQFTISYWLYLNKLPTQMVDWSTNKTIAFPTVFDKYSVKADGYSRNLTSYQQYFVSGGGAANKLVAKWVDADGQTHDASPRSNTVFTTGKWYNVTWVFNNGQSILYINGVKDNIATTTNGLRILQLAGTLSLSSFGNSLDGGIIDELRIYNRALNTTEVNNLYYKSIYFTWGDLAFIYNNCLADGDGMVNYANCYTAIDNSCSIQQKLSKNTCIENIITSYLNTDQSNIGSSAYDPEGATMPWPLISEDLIVKYCLSDLSYARANSAYCKNNLPLIDSLVFETESNAALINDNLNKLGLATAKTASGCSYNGCGSCKTASSALVQAAASCSSGGSTCQGPNVTKSCAADQYVICRSDGNWNEIIQLSKCKAKKWYSYCPITATCPGPSGDNMGSACDCNWLDAEYIANNKPYYCAITYNRNEKMSGLDIKGSDELVCKADKVMAGYGRGLRIGGLHNGSGGALDVFITGATPLETVTNGRKFIQNIGPTITTDVYTKMRALSELMPCEIKGLGSSNPQNRKPMVHIDVSPRRGFVHYNIYNKNNTSLWTNGVSGIYPELFSRFPNQAAIDAEIKECGNPY